MNNAMNPQFGGQPGQGAGLGAQPMMQRPGYGMPLQQQPPRPYAPPPAGYMPVPAPAPTAAPVMTPGVHSSCHGEHGKGAHGCEPSSSYNVMLSGVMNIAGMKPGSVLVSGSAGVPRYPAAPYGQIVRPPVFSPRPPIGPPPVPIMVTRPPGTGIRPMPPVLKPPPGMLLNELALKGGIIQIAPAPEKPHTTVYVGKISSTVEDECLRAILELCGGIKSWKRAQDPTTGTPKGFGFCEFESAEGVLRALRLLNKYSLEGQELVIDWLRPVLREAGYGASCMSFAHRLSFQVDALRDQITVRRRLNVNQATREYLERYVAKKKERERIALEEEAASREEEAAPGVEVVPESRKPMNGVDPKKDESTPEEDAKKFGLVTEADKEVDDQAIQKLNSMLAERAKLRPLPPPPPLPTALEAGAKSISVADGSTLMKEGDSAVDGGKSENVSGRHDDDTISEQKQSSADLEASSADRGRRSERGSERDRERDLERDKEREVERYERERERERVRRDRDRENRVREAERLYEERERDWESREREKDRQRLYDKEREKERERERRREIKEQEEESDDDERQKRRYRNTAYDDKRKRRHREYEEDAADRIREHEEAVLAESVKRQKTSPVIHPVMSFNENDMDVDEKGPPPVEEPVLLPAPPAPIVSMFDSDSEDEADPIEGVAGNGVHSLGREDPSVATVHDGKPSSSPAPPRKLGFGLMGSGRRAAVPSVFTQEDEEATPDANKLRTLVPIDYSAEEMQVVAAAPPALAPTPSGGGGLAHNLAAAAEFAKSLSLSSGKDSNDKDRSRRSRDRTSDRDRDRSRKEKDRDRDREKEKDRSDRDRDRDRDRERDRDRDRERERERERDRSSKPESKVPETKKIVDAKQLIDTIPKTKEELFNFPVDWNIYDSHDLHEKMRPWIAKKITEFLGEEENTLVDFIVSSTRKHVSAATMLELLEAILDDEAEMFVLKMWRMLIFEVRRVETGLASGRK